MSRRPSFPTIAFVALLAGGLDSVSPSFADTPPEVTNKVEIRKEVTNGFVHPGIGLTKEILENARAQVMAGREPWLSGFRRMAADPNSAESVPCRNQSTKDPSKPDSEAFDNRGMVGRLQVDADRAYRQALMYWFTGKDVHRANALRIIRTWSKLDPNKCKSFPEDHIHASYPVQTLVRAAELVRCTSASGAAPSFLRIGTTTPSA